MNNKIKTQCLFDSFQYLTSLKMVLPCLTNSSSHSICFFVAVMELKWRAFEFAFTPSMSQTLTGQPLRQGFFSWPGDENNSVEAQMTFGPQIITPPKRTPTRSTVSFDLSLGKLHPRMFLANEISVKSCRHFGLIFNLNLKTTQVNILVWSATNFLGSTAESQLLWFITKIKDVDFFYFLIVLPDNTRMSLRSYRSPFSLQTCQVSSEHRLLDQVY